jgi:hypothetical protein
MGLRDAIPFQYVRIEVGNCTNTSYHNELPIFLQADSL